MLLFFGSGIFGIIIGLYFGELAQVRQAPPSMNYFMITLLGVINFCLGGFVGFILLTQEPKQKNKKKKKY